MWVREGWWQSGTQAGLLAGSAGAKDRWAGEGCKACTRRDPPLILGAAGAEDDAAWGMKEGRSGSGVAQGLLCHGARAKRGARVCRTA